MSKRTGIVVGVSSVVAVILAAAIVAVAGGGSGDHSVDSARVQTASSVPVGGSGASGAVGQQGGGSGGAATSGNGSPNGTTASSPQGAPTSTPHGTPTSPTTIRNTIKPIPGRAAPPFIDGRASSASPQTNGLGVCRGPNHYTTLLVSWSASHTDYVQLGGDRGKNYPSAESDQYIPVPCPAYHPTYFAPSATLTITAFGPGGEVSRTFSVLVDPNYQP